MDLGRFASQAESWDQAIQVYEQALAQGVTDNVEIYIKLGDAYQMANMSEKALNSYRQAARLAPNDPEVQQRLQDGF